MSETSYSAFHMYNVHIFKTTNEFLNKIIWIWSTNPDWDYPNDLIENL